jgi:hypothetical protein
MTVPADRLDQVVENLTRDAQRVFRRRRQIDEIAYAHSQCGERTLRFGERTDCDDLQARIGGPCRTRCSTRRRSATAGKIDEYQRRVKRRNALSQHRRIERHLFDRACCHQRIG